MLVTPDLVYLSLIYVTVAMVGACMGSFASAIAFRTVAGQSWISTKDHQTGQRRAVRSCCPDCHHQLAWFDLVPVLSWVMSGGRCRYCKGRISFRYPVVELMGAVASVIFFSVGGAGAFFLLFIAGLPFLLAFILLCVSRQRPPYYMYGVLIIETVMVLYVVYEAGKSI